MRAKDNIIKAVRIHNEEVNKWIETLPYGHFTILINDFLEREHKSIKVNTKDVVEVNEGLYDSIRDKYKNVVFSNGKYYCSNGMYDCVVLDSKGKKIK